MKPDSTPWKSFRSQKKEFVSLFVEGIDVDPRAKSLKMHKRRFPVPASLDTGNLSFQMVAGVGFEPTTFGL